MQWKCLSIVSVHVHSELKQGNKITAGMHKEMVRMEGFYLEANVHLSLAKIFSRAFTCECAWLSVMKYSCIKRQFKDRQFIWVNHNSRINNVPCTFLKDE